MSGCHIEAGRLFQIFGSATEKLLSPSRVFVLGTVRTWRERSEGGVSGVRDQLVVIDQVRWNLTSQRRDESGQLVVDPLLHQKPVQATKNW